MWVMLIVGWVWALGVGGCRMEKCGVAKKLKALMRALNESKKFIKFSRGFLVKRKLNDACVVHGAYS